MTFTVGSAAAATSSLSIGEKPIQTERNHAIREALASILTELVVKEICGYDADDTEPVSSRAHTFNLDIERAGIPEISLLCEPLLCPPVPTLNPYSGLTYPTYDKNRPPRMGGAFIGRV